MIPAKGAPDVWLETHRVMSPSTETKNRSALSKCVGLRRARPSPPLCCRLSDECNNDLWVTLPRQETESNRYRPSRRWRTRSLSSEDERLGDALAGLEDTIRQKHADIRIVRARGTAGVLQFELTGETFDYYQKVGVNNA